MAACVRETENKIGELMKSVFTRRALRSGAAIAALLYAGTAFAQDTAAAPEAEEAGDIVVTAQRREERLVDVPVSVAVVQGEQLRDFQAAGDDTLALAGRIPGLYAETTTGRIFPRFYIRGLGNIDFYLGASQPVSIIQDDVVLEHVVLKSNPVYDLDRVEVLRGPQGSLFGRNTTAGIIKFDTIRPSDDFQGRASLSVGEYASTNIDAAKTEVIATLAAAGLDTSALGSADMVSGTLQAGTGAGYDGVLDALGTALTDSGTTLARLTQTVVNTASGGSPGTEAGTPTSALPATTTSPDSSVPFWTRSVAITPFDLSSSASITVPNLG